MASTLQSQLKITLFRGWEAPSAYVWSPFVTKLEARLRFAGVPYRTEGGNPTKAPRGKIPYVAVSRTDNGAPVTLLSDSDLIIEKWIEDGVLENLNAKLQPTGKAHDLAFRAMLEEKLYFYQVGDSFVYTPVRQRSGIRFAVFTQLPGSRTLAR